MIYIGNVDEDPWGFQQRYDTFNEEFFSKPYDMYKKAIVSPSPALKQAAKETMNNNILPILRLFFWKKIDDHTDLFIDLNGCAILCVFLAVVYALFVNFRASVQRSM